MMIVNHLTYVRSIPPAPVGVSLTVPDMTMTIHEIISRYTRGLAVPTAPIQNVLGDVSDFDGLNQFEKIDMARSLKERKAVLEHTLNQHKASVASKKQQAAIDKAIADGIAKSIKPDVKS